MTTFFWLLCAHALADFALQSDAVARGKNRHTTLQPPPGQKPQVNWFYWLTAHALIHGGLVALVVAMPAVGAIVAAVHWLLDFAKCEGWTTIHGDQAGHVLTLAMIAAEVG